MNNCVFVGNLTADANRMQSRNTGNYFTSFTIAVNEQRKDKKEVQYIGCMMGGDTTKLLPYLTKGKKVGVVGRVSCHAYQAKDGTLRAELDLFVQSLELLGGQADRQNNTEDAGSFAQPDVPRDNGPFPF